MLRLEFDLEFENADIETRDQPHVPDPTAELIESLTEWWAHEAQSYVDLPANQRLPPVVVEWSFLGKSISWEIEFDFSLLEYLFAIYTVFGWDALATIERKLTSDPKAADPSKRFFNITKNAVAVLIAHALTELETRAVQYARQKWRTAREQLLRYQTAFKTVGFRTARYRLANRGLAEELFNLCREYAAEAEEVRRLQEEITARNLKAPPTRRAHGSGYELWFEVFAAPQRKSLNKMADLLTRIAKTFPPTVIILDQLPSSVISASTPFQRVDASNKLEELIYSTLQSLSTDLTTLSNSLNMPGVTTTLREHFKPFVPELKNFDTLTTLQLPAEGPEQLVLNAVLARKEKSTAYDEAIASELKKEGATDQRLLANLDLLSDMYESEQDDSSGTWAQVVLSQYVQRLTKAVEEIKRSDLFWNNFWGWVNRLAALTALIALMAVFPFADATAPALISALALCGSAAAVLGVVTLLHSLLSQLENAGQLEADARDKFFRLAQTDPQGMQEVGQLLSRSKALREAAISGALFTILTLGAAHKLRIVAEALNVHAFVSDIQTLFAPAPPINE